MNNVMVTTLAGSTTTGSFNSNGTTASFYSPTGVAVDPLGNVYVSDEGNKLIRKISPDGGVSTLAGSTGMTGAANGLRTAASFSFPCGIGVDLYRNVYVSDTDNHMIRKITAEGVVTTLAGSGVDGSANGNGTAASFCYPSGLALDSFGNVYVADEGNSLIRKITPKGLVSTLAGTAGITGSSNGVGTNASFNYPMGVAVDAYDNVYVADTDNNLIRKITPDAVVTTLAGLGMPGNANGTGIEASFAWPAGIAVDAYGVVYVADTYNHDIRKVTPDGAVITYAGTGLNGADDGPPDKASFSMPLSIAVDSLGNLYVADSLNNMIRKITPEPKTPLEFH